MTDLKQILQTGIPAHRSRVEAQEREWKARRDEMDRVIDLRGEVLKTLIPSAFEAGLMILRENSVQCDMPRDHNNQMELVISRRDGSDPRAISHHKLNIFLKDFPRVGGQQFGEHDLDADPAQLLDADGNPLVVYYISSRTNETNWQNLPNDKTEPIVASKENLNKIIGVFFESVFPPPSASVLNFDAEGTD